MVDTAAPGAAPPAIVARALTKRFGEITAVDGLDLELAAGRIYGLLGPNGSGKTTLIRLLTGLARPTSGDVSVLGVHMPDREVLGRIGYMTQADGIYLELSVWENVRFFGALAGKSDEQSLADALRVVELYERRKTPVLELSGGMRRRLSLACALVHKPEVLFLDEPTVGIDPALRVQFWEYFRKLAAGGATLVVSSHVMDEADRCDELLLMLHGKLLARGSGAQIRRARRRRGHRAGLPDTGRRRTRARLTARRAMNATPHAGHRPPHRRVLPARPPHAGARLRRADRDHGPVGLGHSRPEAARIDHRHRQRRGAGGRDRTWTHQPRRAYRRGLHLSRRHHHG